MDSLEQAFAISNDYAPEHLILALREPRAWLDRVEAAGSVFLGDFTPEALGDYCSGTNHVLPTSGAARGMQRRQRGQLPELRQRAVGDARRHRRDRRLRGHRWPRPKDWRRTPMRCRCACAMQEVAA